MARERFKTSIVSKRDAHPSGGTGLEASLAALGKPARRDAAATGLAASCRALAVDTQAVADTSGRLEAKRQVLVVALAHTSGHMDQAENTGLEVDGPSASAALPCLQASASERQLKGGAAG